MTYEEAKKILEEMGLGHLEPIGYDRIESSDSKESAS